MTPFDAPGKQAFELVPVQILSFGKELTHSHTMTLFDASEKQAF